MKSLLIILLVIQGCATNGQWTRQDTIMQSLVTASLAIDAVQTADIRHHDDINEVGLARLALGSDPSSSDTYQYFTSVAITHYLISKILPEKWRTWWQGGALVVQAPVIVSNCSKSLNPC